MPVATRWPLVGRRDELDRFTQALADPGCEALCIYGPSGVGKTRLGDECLQQAATSGRRVLRASADGSLAEIPFGSVAHLLPARALTGLGDDEVVNPVAFARLFDAARSVLARVAGESGVPVLLLDDAHRVDSLSLTMVDRLVAGGALFCIATVVTGDAIPGTLTRWWRDERAVRIDLAEMDPVAMDTLLHIALEGPLDSAASAELWRGSRGNVLALRELVLGARARGILVQRAGVWCLDAPLDAPARLRELVEMRVTALEPTARAVLDLLALCQPVGLGQLEAAAGLTALEDLERAGLLVVSTDGRRESVRLAHPLHGDALRDALPALQRRSILLRQAELVEAWGARRREDPPRVASWRLEATGRADPGLLLRAARLARYDQAFQQAAKLARAAFAAERSAAAALVLGESLYNLGSFDDAEAALAAATDLAEGDDEVMRIATVRRRNLFRGCRRERAAVEVGRAATARVSSVAAVEELLAGEAEVLSMSGRPAEALELLDRLDAATPRLRVLAAVPRAAALAMMGRTAESVTVSRQAARDHRALGDELAIASPGTHRVNLLFAMVQAGRLDEADERGRGWFDVAAQARAPLGVIWIGLHLGRCALARGRPATALRWSARVCAAIDASGLEGLRPAALTVAAVGLGMLGDAAASAAHADQVDALATGFGFLAPELPLGRAWALIATGEIPAARSLLLASARDAEEGGHLPAAGWLLHDAARIGAAADAAPQLATLAASSDSDLLAARAEHAASLVAGDAERLAACADRFESLGALLLAAESAAGAADAWRRRREQRRAVALDVRSNELVGQCEGARTPALVRAPSVVPLTDREREIALLAATGQTSRMIAERLYLSVRTIDNHLGRVYDKLGVSSRAELAAALRQGQA
ncbi:MAG TPA: AAA family ATPase [Acidimicrobiales bacterium]|nr:AAA family ATPase [Acidimicrobiales bacterium]